MTATQPRHCEPPFQLPADAKLRFARPADWTALDHLQNEPGARDAGWVAPGGLRERIHLGHIHVIELNGEPAGYALATPRPDRIMHISQHIVTEELWRLGLGTALMRRIEQYATLRRSEAITLKCAWNAAATPFWPACGFSHVASTAGKRRVLFCWSKALREGAAPRLPPASRRSPMTTWHDLLLPPPIERD